MDNIDELFNEIGLFRPILFPTEEQEFQEHPLKEKIIKMSKHLNGLTNKEIKEVFYFMEYYINKTGKVTLDF